MCYTGWNTTAASSNSDSSVALPPADSPPLLPCLPLQGKEAGKCASNMNIANINN